MDVSWLVGILLAIFLTGAAVLAAVREWTRLGRWLHSAARPSAPAVTIDGVGGRLSRERDPETGWAKWGSVVPRNRINVNQPDGIYDVRTGVMRRDTDQRVTFPVDLPRIKGDDSVIVREQEAQIPTSWLEGYGGEKPHHQVLYWVTARDESRRRWEFVYDPENDMMRRPRRIRD
jgi:hypothetical protein